MKKKLENICDFIWWYEIIFVPLQKIKRRSAIWEQALIALACKIFASELRDLLRKPKGGPRRAVPYDRDEG